MHFRQSNLGKNFKVIVPLLYGVLCTDTSPSMLIFYSPSNTIVTLQYAGDTTTIQIPVNMFASFVVLPFHQKFNDSQGDITELYISSPDSMAVFLFNPFWPIDILNVLPSDKWGNYYIIPSSFHYLIETWNSDSFLNENIIPLFNQTEIHDTSIFSDSTLYSGIIWVNENELLPINNAKNFTIQSDSNFIYLSEEDIPFGKDIITLASKPIELYQTGINFSAAANYIPGNIHPLSPVCTWGKTYLLTPIPKTLAQNYVYDDSIGYIVHVTAANDSTIVTFDDSIRFVLNANEYVIFMNMKNYHKITGSKRIQVAQYGSDYAMDDCGIEITLV